MVFRRTFVEWQRDLLDSDTDSTSYFLGLLLDREQEGDQTKKIIRKSKKSFPLQMGLIRKLEDGLENNFHALFIIIFSDMPTEYVEPVPTSRSGGKLKSLECLWRIKRGV